MKFVFREIGEKKFSKIVELSNFPDHLLLTEFLTIEAKPYMPKEGTIELIARDGLPEFMSNQFLFLYCDKRSMYTSMGTVLIYR